MVLNSVFHVVILCILKNVKKEEAMFLAARASRTENRHITMVMETGTE